MLSPYPMFMLVQGGTSASLIAGIALAVVCMAGFYSVIAGFVSDVFPRTCAIRRSRSLTRSAVRSRAG